MLQGSRKIFVLLIFTFFVSGANGGAWTEGCDLPKQRPQKAATDDGRKKEGDVRPPPDVPPDGGGDSTSGRDVVAMDGGQKKERDVRELPPDVPPDVVEDDGGTDAVDGGDADTRPDTRSPPDGGRDVGGGDTDTGSDAGQTQPCQRLTPQPLKKKCKSANPAPRFRLGVVKASGKLLAFNWTPVTAGLYRRCKAAGRCPKPTGGGCPSVGSGHDPQQMMSCLNLLRARAYCRWSGGRLPSYKEWQAIKGKYGLPPPKCSEAAIGREPGGKKCSYSKTPPKVCSRSGATPSSTPCDLLGGVWEWTSSTRAGGSMIMVGASFQSSGRPVRSPEKLAPANAARVIHGVRCVYPPP